MLKEIIIKDLFNTYNYDLNMKDNNLTIITGPNGYGKTTILKIISGLSHFDISFLLSLSFSEIHYEFDNRDPISIIKKKDELIIYENNIELKKISKDNLKNTLREISKIPFIAPYDEGLWLDKRTNRIFNTEELLIFSDDYENLEKPFKINPFGNLHNIPIVYLIKEQRLIGTKRRRREYSYSRYREDFSSNNVENYAEDLKRTIFEILAEFSKKAQDLDSSYPRRLFDQTKTISKNSFEKRYEKVKETQSLLKKYGFQTITLDDKPTFKSENSRALRVYLNDIEKKQKIFANLSEKLETFTRIVEKRNFPNKTLEISQDHGFRFLTPSNKPISLSKLSSGEQQVMVLFYELIFKVEKYSLVLIDEPELSLHVAWQKRFLDDLIEIINLNKISVITATHSPQIINDKWDLTIDLEELIEKIS